MARDLGLLKRWSMIFFRKPVSTQDHVRGRLFRHHALTLAFCVALLPALAAAQTFSGLRGPTPLDQEGPADPLTPEQNTSMREPRNYPEQPPLIPHSTEGYEITTRANKCLSCHARTRVRDSKAPMISITHFADRDGQFLASISPRRYFCTECHVPQHNVEVPVGNDFVDIDTLLGSSAPGERR